ncbi:MAG: META domain-containing protein [Anaerolineales bacterium]|nr:META domain-containing protein [Anaerolineales bacterium]
MKTIRILICLFTAASLAACAGPAPSADPVEGEWTLFAYRKTSPIEGTTITARFENGEVSGSGGCNSYFGSYVLDGVQLTIEGLAWTEMACLNPEGVMEQEQMVLGYLSNAESFELDNGRLIIHVGGQETLTFEPAE